MILQSVFGSREEEKQFPWIDDIAQNLGLACSSWKPNVVT